MSQADLAPVSAGQARLAGLLYLGTIIGGVFAEVVVRGRLTVEGDGAATMRAIAAHPTLYRAGEVADLFMLCCYIAVTALLYGLFHNGGRLLSLAAAGFSLTGIAVLACAGIFHMAPLWLMNSNGADRAALIPLSLSLHGQIYAISLVFFGLYCVLIGLLAIRSRQVPVLIGTLMMVGGLAHLLLRVTAMLSPELRALIPGPVGLLPLIGEAALAGWLILFGVRRADRA